jgi:hypothetical protein
MNNASLYNSEDRIITKMGRSFLGERVVFRGQDLHHQLSDLSWVELHAFGITGKKYTPDQVKLLNFIWSATSYPDKSIWPNHIAALAGSYQTTPALGLSASIAACDADIFGGKPLRAAADFFIRAQSHLDTGGELETYVLFELKTHRTIFGYGRPLASSDERIPHTIKFVRDLDLPTTRYFDLAIKIAVILKKNKRMNMNAAALFSAIGMDLGFTPKTFHIYMTLCFVAGMAPCYLEAETQEEGTFLPTRCDRVKYTGAAKRKW